MATLNRLASETSPYLLQHAANPVDWLPWSEEALALARAEDKPILLSIGYSACHWCHVMAHESFEDEAVAAVMNRLFVNIKVDREERPDLDQIYQTAHQMLTGRAGGWPLTLFLTPDGTPFYGGTYFPKEARFGLPGFVELCERVGEIWRTRRHDIEAQNRELRAALQRPTPTHASSLDDRPIHALRALLLGSLDRDFGGFGSAPKFPHPTDLAFLLARKGDAPAQEAALFTLRSMAQGGIHDQLGGGFYRYSVDERWEIPHFEKMLYDNAQLLALYAAAFTLTGEPYFREVAEGIVGWLLREMTHPEGAFYSSLDADTEGEEGRFYLWDRAEVARLLTPEESALAIRHWGLDERPNFENRSWHLKIAQPLAAGEAALRDSARAKLFAARKQRVRPGCDDKILTSWNALMIAGLAHAARLLDRPEWLAHARRALDYLQARHWRHGRLLATSRDGQAHLPAYLDDYAFLIDALLELHETDPRSEDIDFARQLADVLLTHFEDQENGGFFFTAHDHENLIQRPKSAYDNALPSGNGVAARALQRLGQRVADIRYELAARRTLQAFAVQMQTQPAGCATLIMALEAELAVNPPACDGVSCSVPAAG
ncbi:MAG: thioredoxin domain-containing protein [Rhodocyclaceae bacterium]|nr:thioredoxin domain-containing protein [Rhodocyclaceae bacterium]